MRARVLPPPVFLTVREELWREIAEAAVQLAAAEMLGRGGRDRLATARDAISRAPSADEEEG